MPSVGMDAAGNIFLSYCPLIEGTDSGNPSPLAFSYRNVYLKSSVDGGTTWANQSMFQIACLMKQFIAPWQSMLMVV